MANKTSHVAMHLFARRITSRVLITGEPKVEYAGSILMDMQRANRVSACVMQVMKLGKCGKTSGKYNIGELTRLSNYEYACSMQHLVLLKCRGIWALTCICPTTFAVLKPRTFNACLLLMVCDAGKGIKRIRLIQQRHQSLGKKEGPWRWA